MSTEFAACLAILLGLLAVALAAFSLIRTYKHDGTAEAASANATVAMRTAARAHENSSVAKGATDTLAALMTPQPPVPDPVPAAAPSPAAPEPLPVEPAPMSDADRFVAAIEANTARMEKLHGALLDAKALAVPALALVPVTAADPLPAAAPAGG